MADNIISEVELEMGISIEHLIDEFGKIRTGRANPSLVTSIQVEYYGVKTPLQQLASVSVPDPRPVSYTHLRAHETTEHLV